MTSLGRKVAVATRWSILNTVLVRVGNFVAGAVLARYFLSPYDFGLYALGAVTLAVLLSANEMGVSLAVVRWDGDVRRFAPTVLTLSTASSVALYAVLFLAAPQLATLLGSAEATNVLRVLCLTVVIDGIACVPAGLLTREFAQGTRMVIDLVNFVVSTGVTMGLAVAGAGAMSYAWGAIAGNTVALIGVAFAVPGLLRFGWNATIARELLAFGLPLAAASLLVLAMVNVDSFVVGAVLGPAALGFYQIAANMAGWPVRTVSEAARRVSFANFSRLAASATSLADGYCRFLSLLMAAAVPACVLLAILAEPLIQVVYGDRWTPAAHALQFLALLGLIRVAYELTYDCLAAVGRRKLLMGVQGLWLVALVPTLLLLVRPFGISGAAASHVVVGLLLVVPVFLIALSRAGIPVGGIARACARPLLGGLVVAVVALVFHRLFGGGLVGLALTSVAALAAYVPVVLPLRHLLTRDEPAEPTPMVAAVGAERTGE